MLIQARCWERGCKYYRGVEQPDETEATERHTCDAYPNGIPDEIVLGEDLHLEDRGDEADPDIYFERDASLTEEELTDRVLGSVL